MAKLKIKKLRKITGSICITIAMFSAILSIVMKDGHQTFMNGSFVFLIFALILLKKGI